MAQKGTPNPKALGRPSGSINAPIAAFTMAVLLCTYCFSSIRTARQDAQVQSPATSKQRASRVDKDASWVQQALEESQAEKRGKR
ncbi:uncharacterized protein N7503_000767 [Penicillium pulvis]|uniref:uncharacterized protein n=1 Tax=Penicillium pulvis TaxID=1562058 RepID=UPI0025489B41|nr:uncharacterized protein N7503_000767 [Penicillium pulvis]KAJ5814017.1 hypothetical protein N7503_000767 [Penicillium pulvis]